MRPRTKKLVLSVPLVLVGLYVALCVAARAMYPRILFPAEHLEFVPAPIIELTTAPGGPQLLDIPQKDGTSTRALWFPAPPKDKTARTVVYFHGNGETIFDCVPLAKELVKRGLGVALVEYRGYGISKSPVAAPTEDMLYEDGEATVRYLLDHGVSDNKKVALWGTSLGTGIAAEMAKRGYGSKLVLFAPYTSIVAMGEHLAPFLPVSLLMSHRLDTVSKALAIGQPTLVVHGDADEVIPFAMGEKVSKAISAARLVAVKGGHHNDLLTKRAPASTPTNDELFATVVEHIRRQ